MRLYVGADLEPDEPGTFANTHTVNPATEGESAVKRSRRERSFRDFGDAGGNLRPRPVVRQRPCEAIDGARIK
jgi:hypothetical protein